MNYMTITLVAAILALATASSTSGNAFSNAFHRTHHRIHNSLVSSHANVVRRERADEAAHRYNHYGHDYYSNGYGTVHHPYH